MFEPGVIYEDKDLLVINKPADKKAKKSFLIKSLLTEMMIPATAKLIELIVVSA